MDSAETESSMRRDLQVEVKAKAQRRRNKLHLQKVIQGLSVSSSDTAPTPPSLTSLPSSNVGSDEISRRTTPTLDGSNNAKSTASSSSPSYGSVDQIPLITHNELELSCIMAYLDHVFPSMFPLYKPSVIRGGRGWLLVRIMNNETLRHISISLTTRFFSVVPVMESPGRRVCETWSMHELAKRTGQAISQLQRDIGDSEFIDVTRGSNDIRRSAHLLESVFHLMALEVFGAHTERWEMHMNAAITLFRQILDDQLDDVRQSNHLLSIFWQLGASIPTVEVDVSFDLIPWNADQAAFYFSTTVLLAADIISSVSLRKPARLKAYHHLLLVGDGAIHNFTLDLEDIFGCRNSIFLLVSDIADLDAWKMEEKKKGTFSIACLAERGAVIDNRLNDAISNIPSERGFMQPLQPGPYLVTSTEATRQENAVFGRIWAHAARIYLHVVLSGWQPLNSVISQAVDDTILLLGSIPAKKLPALAWPICIAGCLAQRQQESQFRVLGRSIGATAMFGTVRVALDIMEEVWRRRDSLDADTWDMASMLGVLGHHVLLI